MKGKCDVFSGYKQTIKVGLVYVESKLKLDKYGWCIYKLKCQKMVERRYLETNKQEGTADVFRCWSAEGKVTMAFLDATKKRARHSVCI